MTDINLNKTLEILEHREKYDVSYWNPINRGLLLSSIEDFRIERIERLFLSRGKFDLLYNNFKDLVFESSLSLIKIYFSNGESILFSYFPTRYMEVKRELKSTHTTFAMRNSFQKNTGKALLINPFSADVQKYISSDHFFIKIY